jgi:hypothetical protein
VPTTIEAFSVILIVVALVCNYKMKQYYPMRRQVGQSGEEWWWTQKDSYSEDEFHMYQLLHCGKWAAIGVVGGLQFAKAIF